MKYKCDECDRNCFFDIDSGWVSVVCENSKMRLEMVKDSREMPKTPDCTNCIRINNYLQCSPQGYNHVKDAYGTKECYSLFKGKHAKHSE
jgi:hypothetical protein